MARSLPYLLVALALCWQTYAQEVTPIGTQAAETAGATAGARAGEAAGRDAGAKAGRDAGVQAIQNLTVIAQQASIVPSPKAVPLGDEEYERLQRGDPGASAFFREFDVDSNKHWSETEFVKAMRAAVERRFLASSFDIYGTWVKLPKNPDNEVNFKDFLAMASQTASSPAEEPKGVPVPNGPATRPEGEFKHCEEMFNKFDADRDGALSLPEFKQAVSGRIREDKVQDTYLQLPRNTNKGELNLEGWTGLCTNLFGMAASGMPTTASKNPCSPDPCAGRKGFVCVPDPKTCLTPDCAQFKCIATSTIVADSMANNDNEYGRCVVVFRNFDKNRNRAVSYREFVDGVRMAQGGGKIGTNFDVKLAWNRFEKTATGEVSIYEFIHWCVAVSSGENDPSASAKEECWDVFTHFDEDQTQDITHREFIKGMRRARRQGHVDASVDLQSLWKSLPKATTGNLEAGPFVDFCLALSRGDDPNVAAADAQPLPTQSTEPATSGASSSTSSVGENNGNLVYCTEAFKKADVNFDGRLSETEFDKTCSVVANATQCANSTLLFKEMKTNNQTQELTRDEFINYCRTSKVATDAGTLERQRRMELGSKAGAAAGSVKGAEAGRAAGEKAGAQAAASTVLVETESKLRRAVVNGNPV